MILDKRICDRARLAKDPRFDGLFFIGVMSTGIYCRPICPARSPKPENIVYFPTAAAAAEAGLRPCLRCRPETSPGSPAWNGTSATVSRAMLLIRQGALNEGSLEDLALKLGVGSRHIRRLFQTHIGASPKALETNQKILFAKKLLSETEMPVSQIAFASGFASIRRFNAAFKKICGKIPSAFRRPVKSGTIDGTVGKAPFRCKLTLSFRPPFDWHRLLTFFQSRAIPGVEFVENGVYHRTIRLNETFGTISVAHADSDNALLLTTALSDSSDLMPLVERVRRMFDLDANMAAIHKVLGTDPVLKEVVRNQPGLRLPGAWDPFEVAVRAVVGQQISVIGARTVIGRIAVKAGPRFESAHHPGLTHFFPTARELNACEPGRIGMPTRRVETIKALSRAVMRGEISFLVKGDLENFIKQLTLIPGIGDWTAHYIAMRALGEPDAFPAADLGIIKALEQGRKRPTPKQILERAESWRPWRAYAAICLWHV
ncbi:MAG: DNA-3-methyladenine glycosylase 2 family protein [Deltaproteobacteria bacterium]|nr:DNA-3-methyladenine glycosylase 2 family protein [Deltaproteobacteria bacterium]